MIIRTKVLEGHPTEIKTGQESALFQSHNFLYYITERVQTEDKEILQHPTTCPLYTTPLSPLNHSSCSDNI